MKLNFSMFVKEIHEAHIVIVNGGMEVEVPVIAEDRDQLKIGSRLIVNVESPS